MFLLLFFFLSWLPLFLLLKNGYFEADLTNLLPQLSSAEVKNQPSLLVLWFPKPRPKDEEPQTLRTGYELLEHMTF